MEESPSWEANKSLASQEIPRIVCKPKVRYRIYKRPQPKDQSKAGALWST
jgi:hypothetical protein